MIVVRNSTRPFLSVSAFLLFILPCFYFLDPRRFQRPALQTADSRTCSLPPLLDRRLHSAHLASLNKTSDIHPVFGIPDFFGNATECYEADNRLRPYGFGESNEGWDMIDWGYWQQKCIAKNAASGTTPIKIHRKFILPSQRDETPEAEVRPTGKARSAIVLRTKEDAEYVDDVLPYIRSLIVELGLLSGGEYEVMLLVETANNTLDIFSNAELYGQILGRAVPRELQGITYLWNQKAMEQWYPKVEEHEFNLQAYQSLQPFVKYMRPEFEYYWHWETDIRFSGPLYQMHRQITNWARNQSRVHLAAVNAAWYTPNVHKSYDKFIASIKSRVEAENGHQKDALKFDIGTNWGVGEEADLIAFMPIINIRGSRALSNTFVHNDPWSPNLPLMTQGTASARISKRLLHLAHDLQTQTGLWITADTFYTTLCARFSHLKSVYVPHPVFSDTSTSPDELAKMFNPGPAENMGGGPMAQYNAGTERHHILSRMGWWWQTYDKSYPLEVWRKYLNGETCLPRALWHPVKTPKALEVLEHVE